MTPETDGYSLTARIFHWLTAEVVLTALASAIIMNNIDEGWFEDFLYDFHRSLGALLIPIILARLICRTGHPPPPLPADIPMPQQVAAKVTHIALDVPVIVQPILGGSCFMCTRVRMRCGVSA